MHCSGCGHLLPAHPPVACLACGTEHWRNPRPCAGGLVVAGGKVLLVRRAIDPFAGCWDIPGGFCDGDEHPEDTARREVAEETGLAIELVDLLGMWMDRYGEVDPPVSTLNVYYRARLAVDSPSERAEAAEVAELGWFDLEALPTELAFPDHAGVVLAALRAAEAR